MPLKNEHAYHLGLSHAERVSAAMVKEQNVILRKNPPEVAGVATLGFMKGLLKIVMVAIFQTFEDEAEAVIAEVQAEAKRVATAEVQS